jgi:hypothetical protein
MKESDRPGSSLEQPSPKKKESPHPLPRAVEAGVPARALSRRIAVPLGIAAALALTSGGAAAYAMARQSDSTSTASSSGSSSKSTSSHSSSDGALDLGSFFTKVKEFIAPEPERPRLAGDVAEPTPRPSSSTPQVPTPPPSASVVVANPTPPIVPQPPMRLGGAVAPPSNR